MEDEDEEANLLGPFPDFPATVGMEEDFATLPFVFPALGGPGEGLLALTGAVTGLVGVSLLLLVVEALGATGLDDLVLTVGILLVVLAPADWEVVCGRVGVVLERDEALLEERVEDLGL